MNDSAVNKIIQHIEGVKEELKQEISRNREDLRGQLDAVEVRICLMVEGIKNRTDTLEQENQSLRTKIDLLERKQISNNIVVFGFQKEHKDISINFVLNKLNTHLQTNIKVDDINNIHCLGRTLNCPVKIEFVSFLKKKEVLRNLKKLKDSGLSIVSDLTKEQQEEYKVLKHHLRLERGKQHPKKCYIKGNRLVVDNREFSAQELLDREDLEERSIRKSSSAPQTPIQDGQLFANVDALHPEPQISASSSTAAPTDILLKNIANSCKIDVNLKKSLSGTQTSMRTRSTSTFSQRK